MARIIIRTTIDITHSGVRRTDQGTDKELDQQRNYTTFLQVIGLRSVFEVLQYPKYENGFWTFTFDTDRDSVYSTDKDPVGLLKEDLNNVPIITNLDEKEPIKGKVIKVSKPGVNTFVELVDK